MPVEFTADETAALIDLIVGTIERHPFPHSLPVQRLRGILEKIRPKPELPLDDEAEKNGFDDLLNRERPAGDGGTFSF
jgi:hypothetical protein